MKKHFKYSIILASLLAINITHADDTKKVKYTKASFSNDFVVTPMQVVIDSPNKSEKITVTNQAKAVLNVQSKLTQYTQEEQAGGKLVERDLDLTSAEKAKFVVSPPIIGNIRANSAQLIRLMSLNQEDNTELAFRFTVKSLTPRDVTDTGPAFATAYAIPVFVLPKNIHESYKFTYNTLNGRSYIKLTNDGNVHVTLNSFALVVPGQAAPVVIQLDNKRILAGKSQFIEIPKAYIAAVNKESMVKVVVNTVDLMDMNKKSKPKTISISKTA